MQESKREEIEKELDRIEWEIDTLNSRKYELYDQLEKLDKQDDYNERYQDFVRRH